jgi:HK97 family phage prohead protease
MPLDHTKPARLELKAVSPSARTITAYASTWSTDKQMDRIQRGAFSSCLANKKLSEISVLVGHRSEMLPVGTPLEIKEDNYGLLTKTRIFNSTAGDDLLATARELAAAGGSLGLSIGYRPTKYEWVTEGGRTIRLLTEIDLREFSYLSSPAAAANAGAIVTDVKRDSAPLTIDQARAELDELDAWLREQERKAIADELNQRYQMEESLAEIDRYLDASRTPAERQAVMQAKTKAKVDRWFRLGMPERDEHGRNYF